MKELLDHIESLRKEFQQLQPLTDENQQRLNLKFRLEWDFNSNHLEGNTLTYGETELLIIFGETSGKHDVREFDEMRGHDIALKLIHDLANDKEKALTEKFIRELNEIILVKPFYKDNQSNEGFKI
jgi:Fic family protein